VAAAVICKLETLTCFQGKRIGHDTARLVALQTWTETKLGMGHDSAGHAGGEKTPRRGKRKRPATPGESGTPSLASELLNEYKEEQTKRDAEQAKREEQRHAEVLALQKEQLELQRKQAQEQMELQRTQAQALSALTTALSSQTTALSSQSAALMELLRERKKE